MGCYRAVIALEYGPEGRCSAPAKQSRHLGTGNTPLLGVSFKDFGGLIRSRHTGVIFLNLLV